MWQPHPWFRLCPETDKMVRWKIISVFWCRSPGIFELSLFTLNSAGKLVSSFFKPHFVLYTLSSQKQVYCTINILLEHFLVQCFKFIRHIFCLPNHYRWVLPSTSSWNTIGWHVSSLPLQLPHQLPTPQATGAYFRFSLWQHPSSSPISPPVSCFNNAIQ